MFILSLMLAFLSCDYRAYLFKDNSKVDEVKAKQIGVKTFATKPLK